MLVAAPWIDRHGDAIWGGVVGVLATVVVGWIFYRLTVRPRRVDYLPTSAESILAVSQTDRQDLPIVISMSDGSIITDPNLVVIRVSNNGSREILKNEFVGYLKIQFREANVVYSAIRRKSNEDLEVELVPAASEPPHSIAVEIGVFNKREWFEVQFITDGKVEYPSVTARYAGDIGKVRDLAAHYQRQTYRFATISILLFLAAIVEAASTNGLRPNARTLRAAHDAHNILTAILFVMLAVGSAAFVYSANTTNRMANLRARATAVAKPPINAKSWVGDLGRWLVNYVKVMRS